MEFTLTFIKIFSTGVSLISHILIGIGMMIVLLGLIVGRLESWSRFNSIYWAFITALTVGYGDIRPASKPAKLLAIIVAWLGIMVTGIFVAIAVQATTRSFEIHADPQIIENIKKGIKTDFSER